MDLQHAPAEVHIDVDLARALLRDQFPPLLGEALVLIDEGWDNVTFRAGPAHAIRIPRRRIAADLLSNEQRWLPSIAPRLSVAVPRLVFAGLPSALFPWPWSVVEWVPGETADQSPLPPSQAPRLAEALLALHRPAPAEAPSNPFRGVPLEARRDIVEERLARMELSRLAGIWRVGVETAPAEHRVWLHGDLHPRNVVVRDGALAGIIDWGDVTAGDVATDLACAWMLFESEAGRHAFVQAYEPSRSSLIRAAAWAVNFATALLDSREPRHVRIGAAVARSLVESGGRSGGA
jgi:aminoglycoside phosphotransferase (APT) family kinase protein